jgi:hypothetical protein
MNVLAPNYMGDSLVNIGVEQLTANQGLGVKEVNQIANPQGDEDRQTSAAPAVERDRLRTAKAREFGRTKGSVGF